MRDVGAQVAVSQKVDLSGRQATVEEAPKPTAHKPLSASGGPGVMTPGKKLGTFEQLDADVEASERE